MTIFQTDGFPCRPRGSTITLPTNQFGPLRACVCGSCRVLFWMDENNRVCWHSSLAKAETELAARLVKDLTERGLMVEDCGQSRLIDGDILSRSWKDPRDETA